MGAQTPIVLSGSGAASRCRTFVRGSGLMSSEPVRLTERMPELIGSALDQLKAHKIDSAIFLGATAELKTFNKRISYLSLSVELRWVDFEQPIHQGLLKR